MTFGRMPVVVVSGFLGAGKTTLLNHVLTGDHGRRLGVIVNDFGSIAFDDELTSSARESTRMLANGCVCCSLQTDFAQAIVELLAVTPRLETILVEASGAADPGGLVSTLGGVGLRHVLNPPALVTVADVTVIREQEQDHGGELVVRQLLAADVVVLNKCDLVEPPVLAGTASWLRGLGVHAPIYEATRGAVTWAAVLDAPASGTGSTPIAHAHDQFVEWTLDTPHFFSEDQLRRMFVRLPDAVIRAKGVVRNADGVGCLVEFAAGRLELSAAHSGEPGSRLVVIGRHDQLVVEELERVFRPT